MIIYGTNTSLVLLSFKIVASWIPIWDFFSSKSCRSFQPTSSTCSSIRLILTLSAHASAWSLPARSLVRSFYLLRPLEVIFWDKVVFFTSFIFCHILRIWQASIFKTSVDTCLHLRNSLFKLKAGQSRRLHFKVWQRIDSVLRLRLSLSLSLSLGLQITAHLSAPSVT